MTPTEALAQALTEAATDRPGIHAEAVAIVHELTKNGWTLRPGKTLLDEDRMPCLREGCGDRHAEACLTFRTGYLTGWEQGAFDYASSAAGIEAAREL